MHYFKIRKSNHFLKETCKDKKEKLIRVCGSRNFEDSGWKVIWFWGGVINFEKLVAGEKSASRTPKKRSHIGKNWLDCWLYQKEKLKNLNPKLGEYFDRNGENKELASLIWIKKIINWNECIQ